MSGWTDCVQGITITILINIFTVSDIFPLVAHVLTNSSTDKWPADLRSYIKPLFPFTRKKGFWLRFTQAGLSCAYFFHIMILFPQSSEQSCQSSSNGQSDKSDSLFGHKKQKTAFGVNRKMFIPNLQY